MNPRGRDDPSLELAFKIGALFRVKIEEVFVYGENDEDGGAA